MEIEFYQHLESGNVYVRASMSDWVFKIDLIADPTISIVKIADLLKNNYCFLYKPIPLGLEQFAFADLLNLLAHEKSKIIAIWSDYNNQQHTTYLRNRITLSDTAEKFLNNSNIS